MLRRSQHWSLLKIARLAGVGHKVAYEARDRRLLIPHVLGPSDVLPLRTFDALRRVSWPRQNYARNAPSRLRLWEVLAIERSRIQLDDMPAVAGMYVHPAGAQLAQSPSQHAVAMLRLAETSTPCLYLPLGAWAQQARDELGSGNQGMPSCSQPGTRRGAGLRDRGGTAAERNVCGLCGQGGAQ